MYQPVTVGRGNISFRLPCLPLWVSVSGSVTKATPVVPHQNQDGPRCEDRGHPSQRRRPVGGSGGDGQRQDQRHRHLRAQRPRRRQQVSARRVSPRENASVGSCVALPMAIGDPSLRFHFRASEVDDGIKLEAAN